MNNFISKYGIDPLNNLLVCLVSRHCNFHGDYLFVFEACYLSFQMPNTEGSGIDFLVNPMVTHLLNICSEDACKKSIAVALVSLLLILNWYLTIRLFEKTILIYNFFASAKSLLKKP